MVKVVRLAMEAELGYPKIVVIILAAVSYKESGDVSNES
ncbi:hypothetical protein DSUL_100126 [Desulfovibrionales bacterium]